MLRRAVIIGFTADASFHGFVATVVTPMNPRASLQPRPDVNFKPPASLEFTERTAAPA